MNKDSRILVLGHKGMVGSTLVSELKKQGYNVLVDKKRKDLTNKINVMNLFLETKPEYVFVCAAVVGGIKANMDYPVEFLSNNIEIGYNVIAASYLSKVKKLLYLGSSCIYPRNSEQPIKEEYLMKGELEPTNEYYAIAKIAGIKLCQAFNKQYNTNYISVMPTNLYGEADHYHNEDSHVIPSIISKFGDAKYSEELEELAPTEREVIIWGDGSARREFLHVEDLCQALVFLMNEYNKSEIINIGTGEDITIKELVNKIGEIFNYEGKISFDKSKPNGMPRKLLDVSRINSLGWRSKIGLDEGLKRTINDYLKRRRIC